MKIKKIFFSFILIVFTFFSPSCSNKANDKFLLEGNYDINEAINISANDLINKIEAKDSFVLYVSLYSCTSCAYFNNNVLNKFINETKSVIYNIDLSEIEATKNDKLPYVKETPTLLIYNNGQKTNSISYLDNEKIFKDIEAFKNYLLDYVIFPRIIEISEKSLDNKINNKENFYLYIGWSKCGDCKMLNKRILNDYYKNNDKIIYYLESDSYRKNKPSKRPILNENPTSDELKEYNNYLKWLDFANKYNFSSYEDGKVPTLQYYKNGKVLEMIVYLNDTIKDNVITNSFYKEFVGVNVTNDEMLYKMHDDKTLDFLNKY